MCKRPSATRGYCGSWRAWRIAKHYFKSVVAYAEPGMEPEMFSGELSTASIGFEARGKKGFGYDPIFYVGETSLGEMEISREEQDLPPCRLHAGSKEVAGRKV